ncbi:MAG: Ig-like domain-containing protein [Actinomycetota bacterium]
MRPSLPCARPRRARAKRWAWIVALALATQLSITVTGHAVASETSGPSMRTDAAVASLAKPCRPIRRCDTIAPSVTILAPLSGATLAGSVVVSGVSSDNVLVKTVEVAVDGGSFRPAVGTLSWTFTLDTASLTRGGHVLTARAVDASGNSGTASVDVTVASDPGGSSPPPAGGYFGLVPVGQWSSLPSGTACTTLVHRSSWEPRPDNTKRNHIVPDPGAVRDSFAARPRAREGAYDSRWDTWLLARVDGQFTGTTDEIFQWAACKWGLPDDLVRAIAVRESTWYQYLTYPSGRCVINWGCGDMFTASSQASLVYCNSVAKHGYDYQTDFGSGICPKTFSIVGVMSWQDPAWGAYPDNQNGTFPFNRNSTAFAVDYLSAHLRGCFEGWEWWLKGSGTKTYAAGDIWGCVGTWYAGDWHSDAANGYISRVQTEMNNRPWLSSTWASIKPGCTTYGCPGPDPL